MAATTWFGNGGVSGYDVATATLKQDKILLTTGGAADANAITRTQYATGSFDSNIRASAKIRVEYDDWFAIRTADPANNVTTIMAICPASMLSGIPTIVNIWWAAALSGSIFQANEWTPAPPVFGHSDVTFHINGPVPSVSLSANTKYWAAVLPVVLKPGQSVSEASLLPSYTNNQGRAISFWTNRTPAAPIITSPIPNSVVSSGSDISLTIAKNDSDAIFGDTESDYTDCAGAHVQYAPRPTADNPNPAWIDMPFADWGGTVRNKGWWILGSTANYPGDGAGTLAVTPTTQVRCGTNTVPAGYGSLPSGTWQVRVRTFDFGHPYPNSLNPLGTAGASGSYTASTYPAINTSPWSTAVIITVTAQVPSPVPTYPVENAAIPEGVEVDLTWIYRNTAVPPFAQAKRSVRIRKVGESVWVDLAVDQSSASASFPVPGTYPLVSGNHYEWQVAVEDADGEDSTWSEVARFWMVPAAGSGEVRPLPAATIDGATLGCGKHRVFVFRRGGKERVGEIKNISYVDWGRARDDISAAKIIVSGWDVDCGNLLAQLQTWAYEIVIVRENGYSTDRVWEGPITLLTYERDEVTIHAKDVMVYAYRRIIKQKMSDTADGDTVTSRAARVLQNAFAPDDPNVLPYMTVMSRTDDAEQYRTTPAYGRTAFEEVDDMAANGGLDYTCVGRAILLWGTKHRIGTLPEFRDADLGSTPIVSEYGMSMANVYSVSDGNGIHGEAYRTGTDGTDPTYGIVEMLSSSWASDSSPDVGTYTQEGLNKVIQSFQGYAERSIADRYPPPVIVRIPDNTTIHPDTVVSIQQLIPGVVVPLRSTSTLRTVVANQKLDSVKVIETKGEETITITLSPFSRDDNDTGGGEEG